MEPTTPSTQDVERVSTGVERLDAVLHGGLPRYSVVFLAGLPGTGKTILSHQALFANAAAGGTGLYLTTLAEPPIKVLRFLQRFAFFEAEQFGRKVIYGDLSATLREKGAAGMLAHVESLLREHRPTLVVIDSFKALRDTIADPLAFRQFTMDLSVRLTTWEATTLLLGEYSADEIGRDAEFAIADGILYLYGTEDAERQKRYLRVMKMRGTPYFAGEHFFDLDSAGITVFPRMSPGAIGEYQFSDERLGSAVAGLSDMLGGGPHASTVTLISGATGTGKTLVALSFLVENARQGRPGLLVSFEETPQQIRRDAATFGWDVGDLMERGLIDIVHVSPSELNIDQHAFVILERAERLGAKLVVIDSITAFEAAVPDLAKYQNHLWAMTDHFKRHGVSVLLTSEMRSAFNSVEISSRAVSFIADNIVFLRYVQVDGEIRRMIGVLKMRGSGHDRHLRELIIEPGRMRVGDIVSSAVPDGG